MPEQTISKLMTATEPADVAQMALIECVRQMADNGKQTNKLLEGMQAELRDVRERVIRIEATEFKTGLNAVNREIERLRQEDLKRVEGRIDALEAKDNQRVGAKGFLDGMVKYGPMTLALLGCFVLFLVLTGKVVL